MVRALKVSGKGERLGIFSKKTNFYHPSLRETLNFAAKLRLPVTTKQERQEVVESLLSTLGLKDCADVRVGLDSFTSFELVKTLNTYAKTSNKTVVLSIHQLRSEI
ncbi:hypothetical protein BGX23_011999 [Mortierella sp. AD031]|nr:hypothetical protein BGX23_011999 [Mortierella sp. AD031]